MSNDPAQHGVTDGPAARHDVPEVDVLIVGAGLSGIGAACHLRLESPERTFAILESRGASGGTWDLFRYPGVRSDSDMYTLGYSFRPWTDSRAVAEGGAIRQYVRDTAREYDVEKHIRYRHRVVSAEWDSATARWTVTARITDGTDRTDSADGGELVVIRCAFLFTCAGYYTYDAGYTPDLPGVQDFRGILVHPQHWPQDLDLDVQGKRVVVVGSGATAVTLVPALAAQGATVTMLQRSPTYIARIPGDDTWVDKLRGKVPARVASSILRWKHVGVGMAAYQLARHRPAKMKYALKQAATRQLPEGFDVDAHFTPKYEPWDQRLCFVPDGDFFKSIKRGGASIITDTIDHFDATGIALGSGEHLAADVVVTATGLTLQAIGGVTLVVDGEPVVAARTPAYKGMMLAGVPNFALTIGYVNASWTLKADLVASYVCRLINLMHTRGHDTVVPRAPASLQAAADNGELRPLIDLKSGYVLRGIDKLPKQGTKAPWAMPQNYLADIRLMRHGSLTDEVEFSHSAGPVLPGTRTIRVEGRDIRYRETGSGAPLVLLHGIGRSLDDWADQHARLSDRHRVISLDLPGFGWSDPLPAGASLHGMATAVDLLLDSLGVKGPVYVAGNSLGGAVAMRFAADHPDWVSAMVLADPAGFGSEVTLSLRLLGLRPIAGLLLRPRRSSAVDTLKGCFRDRSFITPERIESTLALASRPYAAATLLQLSRELGTIRGIRPQWREQLLSTLVPHRVPTLICWGEKDLILPVSHLDNARRLAPDAEFHLFPQTGHMPQIEQADDFAELAAEFFARHPLSGPVPAEPARYPARFQETS